MSAPPTEDRRPGCSPGNAADTHQGHPADPRPKLSNPQLPPRFDHGDGEPRGAWPERMTGALPQILAPPGAQVWLVEGEKCADALAGLGLLAVSWPGDTGGIAQVDWSWLQGRRIVYWPNQNEPSEKAARGHLKHSGEAAPGVLECVSAWKSDPSSGVIGVQF